MVHTITWRIMCWLIQETIVWEIHVMGTDGPYYHMGNPCDGPYRRLSCGKSMWWAPMVHTITWEIHVIGTDGPYMWEPRTYDGLFFSFLKYFRIATRLCNYFTYWFDHRVLPSDNRNHLIPECAFASYNRLEKSWITCFTRVIDSLFRLKLSRFNKWIRHSWDWSIICLKDSIGQSH